MGQPHSVPDLAANNRRQTRLQTRGTEEEEVDDGNVLPPLVSDDDTGQRRLSAFRGLSLGTGHTRSYHRPSHPHHTHNTTGSTTTIRAASATATTAEHTHHQQWAQTVPDEPTNIHNTDDPHPSREATRQYYLSSPRTPPQQRTTASLYYGADIRPPPAPQQQNNDSRDDAQQWIPTTQHQHIPSQLQVQALEGPSFDDSQTHLQNVLYYRRSSVTSNGESFSLNDDDHYDYNDAIDTTETNLDQSEFIPRTAGNYEWMGRSIETLLLGHSARAPILALRKDDPSHSNEQSYAQEDSHTSMELYQHTSRRRSTASTFGGTEWRRSSQGSFPGGRRGSLSLTNNYTGHGGTLANYYSQRRRQPQVTVDVDRSYERRRGSLNTSGPMYRRRSSAATTGNDTNDTQTTRRGDKQGPNIVLSVLARESTGKSAFARGMPATQCLLKIGGATCYNRMDKIAAGIVSEVAFLAAAIDAGDWTETQTIISRVSPRLLGDPMASLTGNGTAAAQGIVDPNLPPQAPKFYAGGGRVGLERDAFIMAGGVEVMIRMFREKSFVGQEMADSCDARDLSEELVATRLAPCWNETLACLRELVYAVPSLVENGIIFDQGDFLPFLFTLLAHDSCFDASAALIEEILSLLSQGPQQPAEANSLSGVSSYQATGWSVPATTFYLGNVPDLYRLWQEFNCRQLAHFCRILALLIFEPEDRQLLESPTVLKSIELLQLRRNRAVRSGRDSTVDMNQSIILGDEALLIRLLKLLRVMNFAPSLRRFTPYHVLAHFPFIADTLFMLGLGEIDNFDEIDRLEFLARQQLSMGSEGPRLSELGAVAGVLEELQEPLTSTAREPGHQLGHIIHVIAAAQQAGIIVGRNRNSRQQIRSNQSRPNEDVSRSEDATEASTRPATVSIDGNTLLQGLASAAGISVDQLLVRRLYQTQSDDDEYDDDQDDATDVALADDSMYGSSQRSREGLRYTINTAEDAANCLQFNAMLLGPYQVEVLFVLCTLLGGRRKLDTQDLLQHVGLIGILDDMFERLPLYKEPRGPSSESNEAEGHTGEQQPQGVHGPGCECTPESALCVQYLRLLHNFCDRDCDNYEGRRLLLSESERMHIFGLDNGKPGEVTSGLLSKLVASFVEESDESPYRFWLASCIESYLRGSSPSEQIFVAESGLLNHLVEDISSERLHCAGSLQTSFDLLGELSKGNADVIKLLVNRLDEESFRKLMSVAAANLVDSNVFIRSLLLSLERLSASNGLIPLYMDSSRLRYSSNSWTSPSGIGSRSYLTHSWWDMRPLTLASDTSDHNHDDKVDECRESDWFPTRELTIMNRPQESAVFAIPRGLLESVGHFGWVFAPTGDLLSSDTFLPNSVERVSWFLAANQARLLRDLLGVVDLDNINHENICCLNTAVVIAIFAYRRQQLSLLLAELRKLSNEESERERWSSHHFRKDDVVDRVFVQAMRSLSIEPQRETPSYARRASLGNAQRQRIADRADIMRNFREVLWFWKEYYSHRGRDRLSLEFSSHLRFQEWNHVVSLLTADDDSATSLVATPIRLPGSPYQRAARVFDTTLRST